MLTQHKQTQLVKATVLTQNSILQIILTLKLFYPAHPARSAINCDVYVGSKVRVSEFIRFLELPDRRSK